MARYLIACLLPLCAGLLPPPAAAQSFPGRPLRMICVHAPGGGADLMARLVGEKMALSLGQPVVVENRPGASTIIAAELAARATPDGHTLLVATVSTLSINPALYAKLPYDPVRDFAPVTLIASIPFILVVNPALPVKNVQQLVALAKSQPGRLNYGSPGAGTSVHLGGALFGAMAGIDIVHVPYKGTVGLITDLLGGQIQMSFQSTALPLIRSGRLRALGVASLRRSAVVPDLPTIAEQGLPGFEANVWHGLLAPAATPRPVVARLNREAVAALGQPDVREKILANAGDAVGNTPEAFAKLIRDDLAKWGKVVRDAGVKPE